jgi:uncharacterized Ntn-hydrolase superfamily protein
VDLRVDDHAEPVTELGRLIDLDTMYTLMGRGINAIYEGHQAEAISILQSASQHALGNDQARLWEAAAHLVAGEMDHAETIIRGIALRDPRWRVLWDRLGPALRGPYDSP